MRRDHIDSAACRVERLKLIDTNIEHFGFELHPTETGGPSFTSRPSVSGKTLGSCRPICCRVRKAAPSSTPSSGIVSLVT